jgi:hypothetical protein
VPVSTKHNVDCINMVMVQIRTCLMTTVQNHSPENTTEHHSLQYLPEHPLLFPTNVFLKSQYPTHTNTHFRAGPNLCSVRNSRSPPNGTIILGYVTACCEKMKLPIQSTTKAALTQVRLKYCVTETMQQRIS